MPSWKKVIVSGSDATLNSLNVTNGITGSLLGTASFASNGGVTQLLAGANVTLSPTNGKGQVTVSSTSGGGGFNTATGSYGSFYDTTTQTNPVANTPRSMSLNTTAITNGVSVSGSTNPFNTYIKTENAGVYNIQFSAQVDKTDSGADEIVIWLRKNGSDLTDTATTVTLNGNNDKQVAAWNWFVNSAANDYYQIIWYSADTDLRLLAETAGGGHPGIPSVIVTANRVDQFLSNTGSFSGSFTGVFTGSLFGTSSWATSASQAISSSFAINASSSLFAVSSSRAVSSSFATLAATATNATQANRATEVAITDNTSGAADYFIPFVANSSGNNPLNVDSSRLSYVPSTNTLTVSNLDGNAATATSASFATNASSSLRAVNANTASFVTTLNQNILITGSVTIGSSSLGAIESTLTLGPSLGGGAGEGGQLGFNASGGLYTSASFIDNYQNRTRLLKGSNAGSDSEIAWWSMATKQMALPAYTGSGAFPGSATGILGIDSSGNIITTTAGGTGTVTTVGGTGTVNGLTLTGTVTTSGSITLGGTLSNILTSSLAQSGSTIGSTFVGLGSTVTTLAGLTSVTATNFTGTASYATSASQAINSTTSTQVIGTVTGTNTTELVRGNMADNDQFRILVGGTATNAGYVELATADDGTEPIYVRQYTGVFSSLARTATLLDGSGNTQFPGSVSASSFLGPLTGTSSYATSASQAISSSRAISSSFSINAFNATSASHADVLDGLSAAAFVLNSQTSSMTVLSSSFAANASSSLRAISSSYALTASYAISASYEINYETSSSYAENATSASFAINTSSSLFAVSSSRAVSASQATSASLADTAITAGTVFSVYAPTVSSNDNYKIPFWNTTISTTGFYGLLQDSEATFTYNPSTNTVTATNFVGTASYATVAQSVLGTITNANTASNITPAITNAANNRILTANGGGTINGESNLTFDGTTLILTGSLIQGATFNIASGTGAHAEGQANEAKGNYSHAEGQGTIASGSWSHAEGYNNDAEGSYSHAEGNSNLVIGDYAHVEGSGNVALGNSSHAEGNRTHAAGQASHAAGNWTSASGDYQSVIGAYNIPLTNPSAFIIGNGSDVTGVRSNLLYASGSSVEITGSLYVSRSDNPTLSAVFTTPGTKTSPAYTFIGDGDTGMFRQTTNTVALSGGGNIRAWISDTELRLAPGTTTSQDNILMANNDTVPLVSLTPRASVSVGSASYAEFAQTLLGTVTSASFAINASSSLFAVSSSRAVSASQATSASFAISASHADVLDGLTAAAFVLNSQTSSMTVLSSSFAANASSSLRAISSSFATLAASATTATTANSTVAAATFNNGGSGDASGTTFNGGTARTISYNTIGAPSTGGTGATGTWGISISGNAATATSASYATVASSSLFATTAGTVTSASYANLASSSLRALIANSATSATSATSASFALSASYADNASSSLTIKTNGGGSGTFYPLMQAGASSGYLTPVFNSSFNYSGTTNTLTAGTFSGALSGNASTATSASYATVASSSLFATTAGTATSATSAGSVTNAVTFNNGGSGDASGTTFNGSAARTISYNTVGAPSTGGTGASGTWGISISGNAATATSSSFATIASSSLFATTAGTVTTATNATNVAVTDTTSGTGPYYIMFADGTSGNRAARVDSSTLQFNASTNTITVTNLTGTASYSTLATNVLNNSFNLGSTPIQLGNAYSTIAGLSSVTSTTFVGALTGNASTATTASFATLAATATNATNATNATLVTGTSGQLQTKDDRIIEPNSITTGRLQFGFTSWGNDNGSPYADYLHLRSYTDGSGGNDNLVMFRKDAIGMRIYQQAYGSATAYSSFKDVAWTDGTNASGTWNIGISGNAATATSASMASSVSITNQDTTPVTYYLTFVGGTVGNNSLGVDSTTLTYYPADGTFTAPIVNSATGVRGGNGSASTPAFSFSGDTNTGMYNISADVLGFSTNGGERVRIDSNGLGIGGSTESGVPLKAVVSNNAFGSTAVLENTNSGTSALAQLQLRTANQTGTPFLIHQFNNGASAAITNVANASLVIGTNNTTRVTITNGGAMGLGVTPTNTLGRFEASNDIVAYSSSDKNWKKNVKNIDSPLEKLSQINGVEFDWIEDEPVHGNKGHDIGVIAQEIEQVLPEIVQTRESGMKAVQYDKIIPLLIESIKEQQKQIDELKELVNKLTK
jgi:hypothetical protein